MESRARSQESRTKNQKSGIRNQESRPKVQNSFRSPVYLSPFNLLTYETISQPSKKYSREQLTAQQAQRAAQEIAFAPVVFQVSRLMLKFGVLEYLGNAPEGLSYNDIEKQTQLSPYAVRVLLEASLSIGTVLTREEKFFLSKTGWFLLHDKMARINLGFNHDVNYLGLFHLEEALMNGKPEGLKVFGNWPTIYEGLSELPEQVRESWFGFDHFYSDESFGQALEIVFQSGPDTLLDVGGNTGRWALKCVTHNDSVQVTILDLPQQLEIMKQHLAGKPGADRIAAYPCDLLDPQARFPSGFGIIWMSQFLDCFSEAEIISILSRAAASMSHETRLFIMETFWDRQQYETAAYCLTLTSLYFTVMANGNSKMYHSDDMIRCVETAGLKVTAIYDGLGMGHSLLECKKA